MYLKMNMSKYSSAKYSQVEDKAEFEENPARRAAEARNKPIPPPRNLKCSSLWQPRNNQQSEIVRQKEYFQTRFCPQIKYTEGENRKFHLRLRLLSANPVLENLVFNFVYFHIDCLEYHKYVLTLSKAWSFREKPGPGKWHCVTGWFEVFNLILGCLPFDRHLTFNGKRFTRLSQNCSSCYQLNPKKVSSRIGLKPSNWQMLNNITLNWYRSPEWGDNVKTQFSMFG